MWLKAIVIIVPVLAACVVAAVVYGVRRWESETRRLRTRLEAARIEVQPRVFSPGELDALPVPVRRYLRTALSDGQPMVAAASLEHAGSFNMSETAEHWKPFTSTQRVVTRRPGFDWDGRIEAMRGLTVRVHDAYVAGEGVLHATLLGLISVAELRGTPELAQGELMRFVAEAPWYPTALLPSQGIQWKAVDDTSAEGTLKDGDHTVTMQFRFNDAGLVGSVRAHARGRTVKGALIPTPWEGRWWDYERRDGMLVPMRGEAAWLPPDGPKPYWRGRITGVTYEFAR